MHTIDFRAVIRRYRVILFVHSIMRELKHHEKKLLRKTDFLTWRGEGNLRVAALVRRYGLQDAEELTAYRRLCGLITALVAKLRALPSESTFRAAATAQLVAKLHSLGVLPLAGAPLPSASDIKAAAFCRRRLPVVMVRLKMSETVTAASELVRHGHVRVGPETVIDPAFLVTRAMEDHVTWVDGSKIRRAVARYAGKEDDYDLLGE